MSWHGYKTDPAAAGCKSIHIWIAELEGIAASLEILTQDALLSCAWSDQSKTSASELDHKRSIDCYSAS